MAASDLFKTLLYAVNNLLQQHKYKTALAVVKGFRNGAVWVRMIFSTAFLCLYLHFCNSNLVYIQTWITFWFYFILRIGRSFHFFSLIHNLGVHIASFRPKTHCKHVIIHCSYEKVLRHCVYFILFMNFSRYGAKIRAPHALVMTFLFRSGRSGEPWTFT